MNEYERLNAMTSKPTPTRARHRWLRVGTSAALVAAALLVNAGARRPALRRP